MCVNFTRLKSVIAHSSSWGSSREFVAGCEAASRLTVRRVRAVAQVQGLAPTALCPHYCRDLRCYNGTTLQELEDGLADSTTWSPRKRTRLETKGQRRAPIAQRCGTAASFTSRSLKWQLVDVAASRSSRDSRAAMSSPGDGSPVAASAPCCQRRCPSKRRDRRRN